jgi:predicted secreted protein
MPQTRARRRWIVALAVVLLLVAGSAGGYAVWRHITYGAVATQDNTVVRVDTGERFSLAVPDRGASVGDSWTAKASPDGPVALHEQRMVASNLSDRLIGANAGGGGGTRYFVFDARKRGTVTITLHNCFQGCRDERTNDLSRTIEWQVTIS